MKLRTIAIIVILLSAVAYVFLTLLITFRKYEYSKYPIIDNNNSYEITRRKLADERIDSNLVHHYHYSAFNRNNKDNFININVTKQMIDWQNHHDLKYSKLIDIQSINDKAWIIHHNPADDVYVSGAFNDNSWWDENGMYNIIQHMEMIFKQHNITKCLLDETFIQCPFIHQYDKIGILDIGANIGSYTVGFGVHFLNRYPFVNIHSFEPSWNNFMLLSASLQKNKLNNVYLYPYGLVQNGAINDNITFIIDVKNKGHCHIDSEHSWAEVDGETVTINTVPLDIMFKNSKLNSWKNILWMKLDTEGFELFVLKGGKQFLFQYGPCFIKSEFTTNREKIFKFMQSMGYSLYWQNKFNWKSVKQSSKLQITYSLPQFLTVEKLAEIVFVKHNIEKCVQKKIDSIYKIDNTDQHNKYV